MTAAEGATEPVVQRAAGVLERVGMVDRRPLWSPQPFSFLGRQVQHHVPVGDVGDLVGIGEAKAICCLEDDAVEDVQVRDLQHVFDGAELLAARGVDTLVVTGTVTNVCVEDTVRDASTCGLRVVLVADACAALRDQDHNATLHVVYRSYGDVRSTEEVLGLVARG